MLASSLGGRKWPKGRGEKEAGTRSGKEELRTYSLVSVKDALLDHSHLCGGRRPHIGLTRQHISHCVAGPFSGLSDMVTKALPALPYVLLLLIPRRTP